MSETGGVDAVAGYRTAFVVHRRRLVGVAVLLGAHQSLAEDVVDDAFVAAFGPWREGRIDDLGAYLRRSVVNGIYSHARRERVRSQWLARQSPMRDVDPVDERYGDHQRLVTALERLPIAWRTVLVLRFCEDLSEHDTARLLGVAVGTVKSRTARGVSRLRALLEEDWDA